MTDGQSGVPAEVTGITPELSMVMQTLQAMQIEQANAAARASIEAAESRAHIARLEQRLETTRLRDASPELPITWPLVPTAMLASLQHAYEQHQDELPGSWVPTFIAQQQELLGVYNAFGPAEGARLMRMDSTARTRAQDMLTIGTMIRGRTTHQSPTCSFCHKTGHYANRCTQKKKA